MSENSALGGANDKKSLFRKTSERAFRRLGVPYMGSKNRIARDLIDCLPAGDYFVDLFAGGCAMTHAAYLSGKYKYFIANDISDSVSLFRDAINGKFKCEKKWISREDFFELKENNPYIRYLWSFGNSGENYLYAKEIEPYKKAFHYAAVFSDYSLFEEMGITVPHFDEIRPVDFDAIYKRKLLIGKFLKDNSKVVKPKYIAYCLSMVDKEKHKYEDILNCTIEDIKQSKEHEEERLRNYLVGALRLTGITQNEFNRRMNNFMAGHYFAKSQWSFPTYEEYTKMQSFMPALKENYFTVTKYYTVLKYLQSLGNLESRMECSQKDYRLIDIPKNSIVYADPPYNGTKEYLFKFSHKDFYTWLRAVNFPVYVSEYSMPDDFICIKEINIFSLLGNNSSKRVEKLFVHKKWYDNKSLTKKRYRYEQLSLFSC